TTAESLYVNRTTSLAGTATAGAAALGGSAISTLFSPTTIAQANAKIAAIQKNSFSTAEKITPFKDVTNYNNYYEFSTDKYEPAGLAKDFRTRPWTVTIDGLVKKKQVLDVDSIIKMASPEKRI